MSMTTMFWPSVPGAPTPEYAQDNHTRAGEKIEMWNRIFTIVGVVASGKGASLYVPLKTAQDLNGSEGHASVFYVLLDDPSKTKDVISHFFELLPGYSVHSMQEITSLMTNMEGYPVTKFMVVMIAISVSVGFLVIFLAMYTAVLERTREIGILKSLGGSDRKS